MKMVFRWFGEGNDSVSLNHIRQIPGVEGIVWSLHDLVAGEEWPLEKMLEVKKQAAKENLHIDVVESVNIHESIKLGAKEREKYIATYIDTMRKLGDLGVKVICYNFMPVFDWARTDLFKELPDGSTALFYEKAKIEGMDPMELVKKITSNAEFTMPGWEPERLDTLKELFRLYKEVSPEDLFDNLRYFLEKIIPVAEELDIKMAIHPDDPPWEIFGLPRIVNNHENLQRIINLVDSPSNGLTLCSGALGADPNNDVPTMIRAFHDKIPFAHIRNVKIYENGDFIETSHRTKDGSVPIDEVIKAYHEVGFTGYARPDHGRHIWDEKCRPGYGLYDRALGIMYLWGLWDAYQNQRGVN